MSVPLIQVRNLHHTYLRFTPMETVSLRGVDMIVKRGETVGLIGPTGSGKSTLLQHLNGLLRPQQGEVWVDGQSLSDPRADLRWVRQRVGLLFQNPEDQLFERYAGDDVAFGPRNLGLGRDEVRERVRRSMNTVGLDFGAFKDRLTVMLSQGERRRLALAGVLALEPKVLALDEPTAGLDPRGREELLDHLVRWRAEREGTIVLASHTMEDLARLADRVYVLAAGRIVLQGTPREVFGQGEELARLGLGVPVAMEVTRELSERGLPVQADCLTVEEAAAEIGALFHGI
ncbi:MAG: ATP-binding cassette domain-containing protein [Chloroflexota bacterium]|nr:ATP-binding cassette domain-containing protein [Chloroflexota bacterium]